MSAYLARRIEQIPNVEVLLDTAALFSFIGAVPRTRLAARGDRKGRQELHPDRTRGGAITALDGSAGAVPAGGQASRPGVFAAGDVRSGSVKRVASAVGERAMAIMFVHECLKQTGTERSV